MSTPTKLISASGNAKDPNAFMDAISIVARVYNGSNYRTNVILTSDAFGYGNSSGLYNDAWSEVNVEYSNNDPNDPFTAGAVDPSTGQFVMRGYWGNTLYYNGSALAQATMPNGSPDYPGSFFMAGKNNALYNTFWNSRSIMAAYNLADWTDATDWSVEQARSGQNQNGAVLDDGTAVWGTTTATVYTKSSGTGTSWSTVAVLSNSSTNGYITVDRDKFYYCINGRIYTSTNGANWSNTGTYNTSNMHITSYGKSHSQHPKYDYVNDRFIWCSQENSNSYTVYESTNPTTFLVDQTPLFTGPSLTGSGNIINFIPISTGEFVAITADYSVSNPDIYVDLISPTGSVIASKSFNPVGHNYYPRYSSDVRADALFTRDFNRVNYA